MATPSINDLLRALKDLRDALVAKQSADALVGQKTRALADLLASFTGDATPADLAALTQQLQDHATKLEGIAKPPKP